MRKVPVHDAAGIRSAALQSRQGNSDASSAVKVLVYGINFAPEPTGIGRYSGEMATWLASKGNDVHVITAPPYYPAWKLAAGHKAWQTTSERLNGVDVWRTPLWVPAKPNGIKRIVHQLSFALFSLPTLLLQTLLWRPDVIVVVAPAFACAPAGWLAARLSGARAWLHVQDFEVDAAFRMGLLKGRLAEKLIGGFERWMLRRFDRVSTISSRMLERLQTKGVAAGRTVSFPNWVDVNAITPMSGTSPYRAELGIPQDAIVALYSGSMAGKQGLELLPTAARALAAEIPNLYFVLCGEGVCKPTIERDSAGLSNVRILPLQPLHRLSDLLGMADIHLLPQSPGAADLVMPSKLTGMLSSGRPVIATAHAGTELAQVVSHRGRVVPPDDIPAFLNALRELSASRPLRTTLGAAARRYAEENLARDRVLVEFEQGLKRCVASAAASAVIPRPEAAPFACTASMDEPAHMILERHTTP